MTTFSNTDLKKMTKDALILHINELYRELNEPESSTKKSGVHLTGAPKWVDDYYKNAMKRLKDNE